MKRILTIQDMSCIGKCSLTVALPVISAMGIETAVVPTALLSNHTAFSDFTFLDLTDEIITIKNQLKKLKNENITFDAVYTGYLGNEKQIDIVLEFIDDIKSENTLIIVDPAMADFGKLYTGFDDSFSKKMLDLVKKADIVLPNITESAILLNEKYIESGYDENYIKNMLVRLCSYGAKEAVITGVTCENGKKIGVMGYNFENKEFFSYFHDRVDKIFHGTGDVFASCYCGCAVKGFSIGKSIEMAVDFTYKSIEETLKDENSVWYGVNFEKALPYLCDMIHKKH